MHSCLWKIIQARQGKKFTIFCSELTEVVIFEDSRELDIIPHPFHENVVKKRMNVNEVIAA